MAQLNEAKQLIGQLQAQYQYLFGADLNENMTTYGMITGGMGGKDASVNDLGTVPDVNMSAGPQGFAQPAMASDRTKREGTWDGFIGWVQVTGVQDPAAAKGWLGIGRPFFMDATTGESDLMHPDGSHMSFNDVLKTFSIEKVDGGSDSDNVLDSQTPELMNKY